MNSKSLVFLVVALCLGSVSALTDPKRELEIVGKLFDDKAEPLAPEESLELLKELEKMYDGETNAEMSEKEQGRRLVVGLSIVHANVDPAFCDHSRFYDFRYLADVLTPYPNMLKFISYYEAKQFDACKEKNPKFEVDLSEIDQEIHEENALQL